MESVDGIKERIKSIISHEGLSPSKFADIIGVQRSGISHILSGRNRPGLELLNKILVNFNDISGDWLITGKGEMRKSKKDKTEEQTTNQLFPPESSPLNTKAEKLSVNGEEDPSVYQTKKRAVEKSAVTSKSLPLVSTKTIEKIVVFYSDRTFREYSQE